MTLTADQSKIQGMEAVTIRKARKKDIPLLVAFIKELAEYEHLQDSVKITEKILKDDMFQRKKVCAFIISEGEAPAGFALYYHTYSTFTGKSGIYLEDLFVRPQFRKKGYGKRLLLQLAREALDTGCFRIDWSVLVWNEPSIKFYRSIGANPVEDWQTFRLPEEGIKNLAAGSAF